MAAGIRSLGDAVCPHMPVVYVPGNRDYRGPAIPEVMERSRAEAAAYPDLHILDEEAVVLEGVRFVGATLWSDLNLFGDQRLAMLTAAKSRDYVEIRTSRSPRKRFSPHQQIARHNRARLFLERQLGTPGGLQTVVVTHHAPSHRSVPVCWLGDPLAAAFASRLDDLILRSQPALWVHGGVGEYIDYPVGKTRVVCNAKGWRQDVERELPRRPGDFIPDLVIDLGGARKAAADLRSTADLPVDA